MPQLTSPDVDRGWMTEAIELSRRCRPSATAFSVGAVLVGADGSPLASGYSRELGPADHAEEVALGRAWLAGLEPGGSEFAAATLYSSLEPPLFVPGGGAVRLRKAGIAITVLPELAALARAVNAHLLPV